MPDVAVVPVQPLAVPAVTIRPATPEDLDWLVPQLHAFAKFNDTKHSCIGPDEYVRKTLADLMAKHYFTVAERDGELMGFLAGIYFKHLFNPDLAVLCEMFWWVAPEYRHSRAGLMLLRDYIEWGKSKAKWITFALQSKSPVNPETLTRFGFVERERSYILEV